MKFSVLLSDKGTPPAPGQVAPAAPAEARACASATDTRTGGISPSPDRKTTPPAAAWVRSVPTHCDFGPS